MLRSEDKSKENTYMTFSTLMNAFQGKIFVETWLFLVLFLFGNPGISEIVLLKGFLVFLCFEVSIELPVTIPRQLWPPLMSWCQGAAEVVQAVSPSPRHKEWSRPPRETSFQLILVSSISFLQSAHRQLEPEWRVAAALRDLHWGSAPF